jgi:hypothetical protein
VSPAKPAAAAVTPFGAEVKVGCLAFPLQTHYKIHSCHRFLAIRSTESIKKKFVAFFHECYFFHLLIVLFVI